MTATPHPDDDGPKILNLPTRKHLRDMEREFRKLKDKVPYRFWPDEPDQPDKEKQPVKEFELTEHEIWQQLRAAILKRDDPAPLLVLLNLLEPQ